MRGRLLAVEGRLEDGLALMREGVTIWKATGAGLALPYYLSHLAEAHLATGDIASGVAAVNEGLALVEAHDERNYVSELHRVRGALLAADPATSHEAEASFAEAVSLARRAVTSFADYLIARGRSAEAGRLRADLDG